MNRFVSQFFKPNEILYTDNFYKYINKKKVIVFVPLKFLEKLALEMSEAGGGVIGNYLMCSFRTHGTGTFKPDKKSRPFSGKKNQLNYVEEVKLEMECDPDKLNSVIDSLIKHHPYDEVAYEIYDFKKRDRKLPAEIVMLKSKMNFDELLGRLNQKINFDLKYLKFKFEKLVISALAINEHMIESAIFMNCQCILSVSKKNYKLLRI